MATLTAPAARAQAASEYQLKAAFLFNFAQFVEWPPAAFPDADAPLVIGVLGTDPFGKILDDIVRGEAIGNRRLIVQRYQTAENARLCHILFISESEAGRLGQILQSLRGKPILTVGETEGYALSGVMIRFMPEGKKIRFRINHAAATASNLTISSKLLRAAEIVTTDKK